MRTQPAKQISRKRGPDVRTSVESIQPRARSLSQADPSSVAAAEHFIDVAAVWVKLSALKPWPQNPTKDDPASVRRVAESIRRFGFGAPLVARKANSELIAGHTRLRAAKQLGLELVPVRYLDISEKDAHVLALADNRLAELTLRNDATLAELLKAMEPSDQLLAGYTGSDVQALLRQVEGEPDVIEDEAPEPPKVPITKRGDVWTLGRHRLVCGDAADQGTLDVLFGEGRASLMVTDPPYGVSVTGGTHDPRDPNYRKGHERGSIQNDELTGERLEAFLRTTFKAAASRLHSGAAWYVWHPSGSAISFWHAAQELGGARHCLVWVKPNFVFGRSDYHYRHEACLYGWLPGAAHSWVGSRDQSSVFECPRDGEVAALRHPTVKPVRLYAVPVANHLSEPAGVVFDPFAGSGPVFSAAEQLDRRAFGIELSPAYCDVIVERWQNLTGGKAERGSI